MFYYDVKIHIFIKIANFILIIFYLYLSMLTKFIIAMSVLLIVMAVIAFKQKPPMA